MPVGVQCPISSSPGEFPSYWDWLWCPGLSPVLVSITLPFAFHTWCFPFAFICHLISIVFLLYVRRIATHSVDPSLTHFLGELPGLALALGPSIKYVTLFLTNFDIPSPLSHFVTHLGTPHKVRHIPAGTPPKITRCNRPEYTPGRNIPGIYYGLGQFILWG